MSLIRDLRRDSPAEPDYTCPFIDNGQGEISHAKSELEKAVDRFDEIYSGLEKAREINTDLRAWGEWWREKAEELADKVDELETELAALRDVPVVGPIIVSVDTGRDGSASVIAEGQPDGTVRIIEIRSEPSEEAPVEG